MIHVLAYVLCPYLFVAQVPIQIDYFVHPYCTLCSLFNCLAIIKDFRACKLLLYVCSYTQEMQCVTCHQQLSYCVQALIIKLIMLPITGTMRGTSQNR